MGPAWTTLGVGFRVMPTWLTATRVRGWDAGPAEGVVGGGLHVLGFGVQGAALGVQGAGCGVGAMLVLVFRDLRG